MKICLDTNAYSDWTRGKRWVERIATAERVFIPAVVLGELREGFLGGSLFEQNESVLAEVMSSPVVQIVVVDEAVSALYAELKFYLKQRGTPIPINDIWIAACSIANGCVLLTSDRHFEKLPQVRVRWPK